MFAKPTVLVLGAGASVDFGLPLGKELWWAIVDQARSAASRFEGSGFTLLQLANRLGKDDPKVAAYFRAICKEQGDGAGHDLSPANISRAVSEANVHASVDDFLHDHPAFAVPITALMAGLLFERLYEREASGERWRRNPHLDQFKIPDNAGRSHISHWVRQFVGLARQRLSYVVAPIELTVVNFNYDRIFESVLREVWSVAERPYPPFEQCFRILYPHGCFSSLPKHVTNALAFLDEQSGALTLAGSEVPDSKIIEGLLANADVIYMAGFSCGEANASILGLANVDGSRIFAQNFEARDTRLKRVLCGRYKMPESHFDTAAVHVLVQNGFFEQG